MCYIRKQVLEASHGISAKMLCFEDFYTIPNFVHNTTNGDCIISYTLLFTWNTDHQFSIVRSGVRPTHTLHLLAEHHYMLRERKLSLTN